MVNMSESERMPGYRKRSQVPPMDWRRSRMRYDVWGRSMLSRAAAPMPDRPAPMMSTSTSVTPVSLGDPPQPVLGRSVLVIAGEQLDEAPDQQRWRRDCGGPRLGEEGVGVTGVVVPVVGIDLEAQHQLVGVELGVELGGIDPRAQP